MTKPPQDSAGQSRLDILIAEYLSQVDDSVDVDLNEFLKPHSDLAEEFHAYLLNARLADVIAVKPSPPDPHASQDTTPSMLVDETLAVRPNRPEYVDHKTHAPQQSTASDVNEALPRSFGRYTLLQLLGHGAMGSVYLAEDPTLKRQVALKIPKLPSGAERDAMLERFAREARSAAAIEHPNICPVYEVGEHEGQSFIAMMLITGKTLGELFRSSRKLNDRVAITFIRKIALALAEAHDRGIIHRDLKPSNLMVNQRNEPIVMDFGLAREIHAEGQESLTQDGTIIGTPIYMSPEQVEGIQSNVGAASDIYSLGVVFYELLTGQVPFTGTIISIMHKISSQQPPSPTSLRADLAPEIEAVCLKMMHKQPAQRYGSMHEVAEALAGLLRSDAQTIVGETPLTGAQLKAQAAQVNKLDQASRWPEAEELLMQMEANTLPIAANYAKWATEQLKAIRSKIRKTQADVNSRLRRGQSCMEQHDYVGAIELMVSIPDSMRPPAATALLENATVSQMKVDGLFSQIEHNFKTGQLSGTLQHLQNLLTLKPNDPVAQYLFRRFKWQMRFGRPAVLLADAFAPAKSSQTRPTYEEPFLRKWIGIATLVFALFTIGTAAAVTIYIKQNGKQKVAVRITDEAMAEGEVEVEVVMDNDQETVSATSSVADVSNNEAVGPELSYAQLPPFKSQTEAAQWIIAKGGQVMGSVERQKFGWVDEAFHGEVNSVYLYTMEKIDITPQEIERLAALPQLKAVFMNSHPQMMPEHLRAISTRRELKELFVRTQKLSNATDADFGELVSKLPQLTLLRIDGFGLNGLFIEHICSQSLGGTWGLLEFIQNC